MAKVTPREYIISKVSRKRYPNIYKNILETARNKQGHYYLLNGGTMGVFSTVQKAKNYAIRSAQKGIKSKRPIKFILD